ncbi:MAG: dTMP kinase [Syntrophomonadaceae bacterium]|nr:dTMP kinase [Syntrophomonadaceae bacterium]
MFISLEGIDACGKSTLIRRLKAVLDAEGEVICVREPGGTKVSEQIRDMLLDVRNHGLLPRAEALLYAAARAQLVDELLLPVLAEGKLVLADRYLDSTIAYQGQGRGLDEDYLDHINRICTGGLIPDLTLLLDVTPDIAAQRKRLQGEAADRLETEGMAFQTRVREAYLRLAQAQPQRIAVIDASQDEDAVLATALELIKARRGEK